jgi:hypothetical protein
MSVGVAMVATPTCAQQRRPCPTPWRPIIMKNGMKLVMGGLAAAMVLAFAVGTAAARRIQVSEQRFYVIWSSLEFEFGTGSAISCPVTLLGSFHSRTMAKVSGQLIGYVTHVDVGEPSCSMRALRETLPWHVQYNSFAGALPAITRVRVALINTGFLFGGGIACLYMGTQARPAFADIPLSGGEAPTLTAGGAMTLAATLAESLGCPESITFAGSANVRAGSESSTTRIRVTLVQ